MEEKIEIDKIEYLGKRYTVYWNPIDKTVWVKDQKGHLKNYQATIAENAESATKMAVEMLRAAGL